VHKDGKGGVGDRPFGIGRTMDLELEGRMRTSQAASEGHWRSKVRHRLRMLRAPTLDRRGKQRVEHGLEGGDGSSEGDNLRGGKPRVKAHGCRQRRCTRTNDGGQKRDEGVRWYH